MSHPSAFRLTYWGTTGTIAAPMRPAEVTTKLVDAVLELARGGALAELLAGPVDEARVRQFIESRLPFYLRSTYGGNTTCAEVQTDDALIILDAGSGLRELGIELKRRWANAPKAERCAHVLLTHAHMDHTCATPVTDPYYDPRNDFTLWGPQPVLDSLDAVLSPTAKLKSVYFPPSYELMAGLKHFETVHPPSQFDIGQTHVSTHELRHPGGCIAYRLDRGGHSLVFATDHEHDTADSMLAEFSRNADVLYLDGQYTADEYHGRAGIMDERPSSRVTWGHSPIEASVATAVAARVKRLHIGHHEPKRDDKDLARIESYAQRLMAEMLARDGRPEGSCHVELAREGQTLEF